MARAINCPRFINAKTVKAFRSKKAKKEESKKWARSQARDSLAFFQALGIFRQSVA